MTVAVTSNDSSSNKQCDSSSNNQAVVYFPAQNFVKNKKSYEIFILLKNS